MRPLLHRRLAVLLTIALLLALGAAPAPAADQPAIGAEQAVAIVQDLLHVPPVVPTNRVHAYQDSGRWFLTWQTPADGIAATVDATTGMLWGYARDLARVRPFRYTPEEARTLAEAWLTKLAPELVARLRPPVQAELFRSDYRFTWDQLEQGYPLRENGVTIQINGYTGELSAYYRKQNPHGSLVAPTTPPDPAAALQTYREKVGLELSYRQAFRPGTQSLWWGLVYRYAYTFPYMDLVGNLFDHAGTPLPSAPAPAGPLVPPVAEPLSLPAKPLTAAEATAVAQAVLRTEQNPDYIEKLEWAGGRGDFWNMEWALGGYAAVDAGSGLLVRFSVRRPAALSEQMPIADAQAIAVAFIRQFRPDLTGRLVVTSPFDSPTVQFQVLKDGIPLNNRYVEVDVDRGSGQVIGFRTLPMEEPGERFPFEDATGIISAQEAMTAFLQQSPLELTWVTFERADGPETQLVWAPRSEKAGEVSAHSGIIMETGGPLALAPGAPADLAAHPARGAVQLLMISRIIPPERAAFRPDEPAALADLTEWLHQATGRETVPPGLSAGVDVKAPLSRQVFALWAVQAAGYGPVAAMKARIELPFADSSEIGAEYANAAGLLAGLGIIPADRFEPHRGVTRGEAAMIIQGIITHLQEDAAP